MISQECRDAINDASKLLEPYKNYKFIKKALDVMHYPVYREDEKIAYEAYEKKRKYREKELLTALNENKTIQYCYSRNRDKKPLVWDDLPKEKAYRFIEHGMWDYMKIKDEDEC
jgi:hypothetical protein